MKLTKLITIIQGIDPDDCHPDGGRYCCGSPRGGEHYEDCTLIAMKQLIGDIK